ncbi:hypothetical protein SteCoe_29886 [Stentor coeruleus]|uniref:Uncharacterized protein n=1 Tax=Stentor coeruleus TaxID=5963 RepID=A0A1R2B547_9CILI|nr:hypothetical protein SteCoe_29886 [Stentor coeruleus]
MSESRLHIEGNILTLNKKAMENLRKNSFADAYECLNEAEKILKQTSADDQLWAITLNNYGCYYKKVGKHQEALACLKLAIEKDKKSNKDQVNLAGTHLNISSIYSQNNSHETALKHATKALKILQKCQEKSSNVITTLIISYHNTGLEYEALQRTLEAMQMFKLGWELGKDKLGENHLLTLSLKRSLFSLGNSSQTVEAIPCIKLSKVSIRKPQTSIGLSRRKCASSSLEPKAKRENFPQIQDHYFLKENLSGTHYEKSQKKKITLHSADKFKSPSFIPTTKRKPVQNFSKKKYEALQSIVDELEGNIPKIPQIPQKDPPISLNNSFHKYSKAKSPHEEQRSSSIGIQVELIKKVNDSIFGISNEWKRNKGITWKKKENIITKVQKAENKVKEALKDIEIVKQEKVLLEKNEKKELIPIPNKTKVEFFRHRHLHTIYEARYEDQLEAVILIQSFFRMCLTRKHFKVLQNSVLTMQKSIRKYLAQEYFRNILDSAILIQSVFRGHRVRKIYNFLLNRI